MTESYKKSSILIETGLTTLILVIITRILYSMQGIPWVGEYYTLIFALLFLYVPIVILRSCRRPIEFFDRGAKQYLHSILVFVVVWLIVFPLFLEIFGLSVDYRSTSGRGLLSRLRPIITQSDISSEMAPVRCQLRMGAPYHGPCLRLCSQFDCSRVVAFRDLLPGTPLWLC